MKFALYLLLFSSLECLAAPTVLYAGMDVPELRAGQTATFSLVAGDSSGVANLAGAVLIDGESNATYGTFQTGANKGAYQLSLSYEAFEKIRPVAPGPFGGESRFVRARVFNSDGESADAEFKVKLVSTTDYKDLPANIFSALPDEWQLHFNELWISYFGSQEFKVKVKLSFEYDRASGKVYVYDHPGQAWRYSKQGGTQTFEDLMQSCRDVNGRIQGAFPSAICAFNLRCIRKNESTRPNCWSY